MLVVDINAADRAWHFEGVATTGTLQTPLHGEMRVSFTLRRPNGDTISSGGKTVRLRPDRVVGFLITTATVNPSLMCLSCGGAVAFPLSESFRVAGRDSVWIVWGGNSISNPVLY
jgi:hypothetical protein